MLFIQEDVLRKAAEKAMEEQERKEARALPSERIQINSDRLEKAKELRDKQVSGWASQQRHTQRNEHNCGDAKSAAAVGHFGGDGSHQDVRAILHA